MPRSSTGLFATVILLIWSTGVFAEDITVSYASLGAAYMDHVVAIEKGYALEEGLNIRILRSGGGSATERGVARRPGQDHLYQSITPHIQIAFKQT